jgi:hypothetical protein
MTHRIQALLSRRSTFAAGGDTYPFQRIVQLPQDFAMIICTDEFLEGLASCGFAGDLPAPNPFERLTPAVVGYARKLSSHLPVAYLETDYWGGLGGQAAVVFSNGSVALPPCQKRNGDSDETPRRMQLRDYPINRALAHLGVEQTSPIDLFDSLGLGTLRSNEDWLSPPEYLRRH